MAYKNLVAESIATRKEAFMRFRDWMCKRNGTYDYSATGLGWTLHDSSYAINEDTISTGDWFVMYSAGESGQEDIYVKVVYSAVAQINQITIHQYWNNVTHSGVNSSGTYSNWQLADAAAGTLYIYADMDFCLVGTYIGTSKYACSFGLLDALYDRTIATSSSSVSSGSSVVVTMDAVPSSWAVGGKVMVRDNAEMEWLTISGISGLDVTFATVVASYSGGCKFAKDYPLVWSSFNSIVSSYRTLMSHDGTKQDGISGSAVSTMPGLTGDPDPLDGEFLATPYSLGDTAGGFLGTMPNVLTGYTGFTDLAVYTTPESVNYRAFISWYNIAPFLIREV